MNKRPIKIILEDIFELNMHVYKIDGHYVDSSDNSLPVDRDELPDDIESGADIFMRYALTDDENKYIFFDFNTKISVTEHKNSYRGEFYMLDAFGKRRFFDVVHRTDVNPENLSKIINNNNTSLYQFILTYSDGVKTYSVPSVFKDSKRNKYSKANAKKLHERIMATVGDCSTRTVQLESIVKINELIYSTFTEMFKEHSYVYIDCLS
ncbi:hypothetical protein AMD27_17280 (plasmid) [Acinetobacter sp. TGL-Y2]|uniref:hypothetical protein n=1 Tax=Acinetobacter sp. TGL-Y2 TaxID=1407071 RepID=UPI0007A64B90|nr:hypothetical protein [Acinetobacter sp. TGL-Y2]AMW80670.1 hypothetical protein AMD27_17280 [Acinetobacter sp. TGL-Y2]